MDIKDYTFGGRINPRHDDNSDDSDSVIDDRMAFVYQRLSTHEQTKKSQFSIERQDALRTMAKRDGYKTHLADEEIKELKNSHKYGGYFVDGQVWVEQRDLGISGTLDKDERPGLAQLVELIEKGMVGRVYVAEISRISRDQTLISGFAFGELCKNQDVRIVTPVMELDLRNDMHMRMYRYEIDRAAEELKTITYRLHGARDLKAAHGLYAGGSVPPGYVLDADGMIDGERNPNYQKYKPYEPHAEVVQLVFDRLALPGETPKTVAIYFRDNGIAFPPLPEEIAAVPANTTSFCNSRQNPDRSYPISRTRIASIARNPAYIGWWFFGGDLISRNNHPAIIDEEKFWTVQKKFGQGTSSRSGDPLPLAGFLYCLKHDPPRYMIYANTKNPRYHCRDHMYGDNCFTIHPRVFDIPVGGAVLEKCSFSDYETPVLKQLEEQHHRERNKLQMHERELQRLTREIENLKENLALTRTKEQVQMILEMIDEKIKRKEELADISNYTVAEAVTQTEIQTVRAFLNKLPDEWKDKPNQFKNDLLRILLHRVYVDVDHRTVKAYVVWRTGIVQELLIYKPFVDDREEWTDEEKELLKKHYPDAPREEIEEMLGRDWYGIRKMAEVLGVKRSDEAISSALSNNFHGRYTEEEDQVIHDYFACRLTKWQMLEKLDRSWDSIYSRATKHLGYSFRERKKMVVWRLVSEYVIPDGFDEEKALEIVTSGGYSRTTDTSNHFEGLLDIGDIAVKQLLNLADAD